MALLLCLHREALQRGWELSVAHVDHGLRPESGQDAAFVQDLALELGLSCLTRRVEVDRQGRSPEEAARLARREALLDMADQAGAEVIALAHHAGDQAETLVMRMLAGTGPSGLAGMRVWSPPFWRPFLHTPPGELRAFLRARGQAWREDPSNQDSAFTRNRVRHSLLPLARELVNPRAEEALGRLATLAADEEAHWQSWCADRFAASGAAEGDSLWVAEDGLAGLSPGELRRLLRWLAGRLTGSGQHLLSLHLDQLLDLAGGPPGRRLTLPHGLGAWREHLGLRLGPDAPPAEFSARLDGPGWLWLPHLGRWLAVEPAPAGPRPPARGPVAWLPAGRVAWPLTVRPPRTGERFRALGAPGAKRLSRFFIDQKTPVWWRRRSLVVADRRGTWWVGPWAPSERARSRPGENEHLCLRLVDRSEGGSYTNLIYCSP